MVHDLLLFLDTGRFTAALTEIEEFSTTYTAYFIEYDRLDIWRVQRKQTLNTYPIRDLSNSECLRGTASLTFDHITLKRLDTLFISFNDFIVNGNVIASFEFWEFFFTGHLLVNKSYGIHFYFDFGSAKVTGIFLIPKIFYVYY